MRREAPRNSPPAVTVVVLAGDRGPGDALARDAGVAGKTLVPVAGRAMLAHVLDVARSIDCRRLLVVAPESGPYRALAAAAGAELIAPAAGPVASLGRALEAAGRRWPVLVLTGDHPLMQSAWLHQLTSGCGDADVAVGLADADRVRARFPGSRRTVYRFRDRPVCGTNLFYLQDPAAGERLVAAWRPVEAKRKRPWRIVGLLGAANLARYLAGRLSVDSAFAALSRRLEVTIRPVLMDDPLTAVDVDSPADLALVRGVLETPRGEDHGPA